MNKPSRLAAWIALVTLAAASLTACDRMNSPTTTGPAGPASAASR